MTALPHSPGRPPGAAPTRLLALDGVRGSAIGLVVAFHTAVMATRDASWAGEGPPPLVLWPVFAGKLGVDVFFVLSGFLILRSWQSSRRRYDGHTAVEMFARRRAGRLLPAYWFSLVVLVGVRVPGWLTSFDGLADLAMFFSLQQFLEPHLPHHVNVVTWSLTTEVHFYLLLPLFAYAFRRYGWRTSLGGLALVAVAWRVLCGGTGEEAEWIIGRADQFAAGMAAATVVERAATGEGTRLIAWLRSRAGAVALGLAATAAAVPLGALQLRPKPLAYQAVYHTVFGLVVAAWIVRGMCGGWPAVFEARALRGLGHASYSLYLWHWPVMMEATRRFGASAGVLAAALAVTAVITALSYVAFERPFLRQQASPVSAPRSVSASGHARLAAAHR